MKPLKRVVIKIGSNSLSSVHGGINGVIMDKIACTIASLQEKGVECLLVTSGAVAAGLAKMSLAERPKDIAGKQAAAAIGQGALIEKYSYFFEKYNITSAQILLSRIDLVESSHYRNAQNTLERLLKYKVVPIINENDTVVVEELCFGDNDRLSALVAGMIHADLLILLTDVDGLFTENPLKNPAGKLIKHVDDIANVQHLADGVGSSVGTGGMVTKLKAAEMASKFGIITFLMNSSRIMDIIKIPEGEFPLGTYFEPAAHKLTGKKQWIAYAALSTGTVIIDKGACKALIEDGKSLLASGIKRIEGYWERKDLVRIISEEGKEIARGIIELNSQETEKTKGLHSEEMLKIIPDLRSEEVIHRDNMTIIYECR